MIKSGQTQQKCYGLYATTAYLQHAKESAKKFCNISATFLLSM